MSWLPLKGTRHMTWITWLWSNVRWQGTSAPWDKGQTKCILCGQTHGKTVHNKLTQCPQWEPAFKQVWIESWED